MKREMLLMVIMTMVCVPASTAGASEGDVAMDLEGSLRQAELAFALTMAERDLEAFASFVDEDAIFSTPVRVLRGRDAIVEGWSRFFESPEAPFSWRPERVHVPEGASLGGTTGPVFDPAGAVVGQFVSTWRRDASGEWRIILDIAPDCRALASR